MRTANENAPESSRGVSTAEQLGERTSADSMPAVQKVIKPDLTEARRLFDLGFKLCKLMPNSKRPEGGAWNLNPVETFDEQATGYGVMLSANELCSVDPDNARLSAKVLAGLGFDLERVMAAGARSISTRPDSGGRAGFRAAEGLRWVKFSFKETGTVLELRAASANLQDVVPGLVYADKAGALRTQRYADDTRLDAAPELPQDFLEWWRRMSTDLDFLREQQRLAGEILGLSPQLSISNGDKQLAFKSPLRIGYNAMHSVEELLLLHGYEAHGGRYMPPTGTGAPGVRAIRGKVGLWQSDHASDPLFGTFDAWSAFVVLEHDGDLQAAEAAEAAEQYADTLDDFDDLEAAAASARADLQAVIDVADCLDADTVLTQVKELLPAAELAAEATRGIIAKLMQDTARSESEVQNALNVRPAKKPLHPVALRIVKDVAAKLRIKSVYGIADLIGLDSGAVASAYTGTFWQPEKSKFYMVAPASDSPLLCVEAKFPLFVRDTFGRLFDAEKLEQAVRNSPAAQDMDSDSKRDKLVEVVAAIPAKVLAGAVMVERQAAAIRMGVDMFATSSSMTLRDGVAAITYTRQRLAEPAFDARLLADYKAHFPALDRFLSVFAAAVFAASRKKAYLWLQTDSDWGKSFFTDVLKKHGVLVLTTTTEIKKMYEGNPCGKSEADFKRAFILAVDEFKGVNAEVKLLTNEITFAPKNQLTMTAPLYMKLFLSAERAESLLSEAGIEDQFANRFTHYKATGNLERRAVFAESNARYFDTVYGYIGQQLNRLIDGYVALGRVAAADAAQRELEAFYGEFRIDRGEKRLSEMMGEHAESFARWVIDTYRGARAKYPSQYSASQRAVFDHVRVTGDGKYAIQSATKVCAEWMKATFTEAEAGRLGFKKREIIDALGGTKTLKVRQPGFDHSGADVKVLVLDVPGVEPFADEGGELV